MTAAAVATKPEDAARLLAGYCVSTPDELLSSKAAARAAVTSARAAATKFGMPEPVRRAILALEYHHGRTL